MQFQSYLKSNSGNFRIKLDTSIVQVLDGNENSHAISIGISVVNCTPK